MKLKKFFTLLLTLAVIVTCMPVSPAFAEGGGSDATAFFHATVTSQNDTYNSGESGIFSVSYKIDRGKIHEDDYIIVDVPTSIAEKVTLQVSSKHFKTKESLGNGKYKLVFASGAESAISGGFSMIVSLKADQKTTDNIVVADAAKEVTVLPGGGSSGGSGTYDDAIMKDIEYGNGISYGGYDYSGGYGKGVAQVGIYESGVTSAHFRLYINNKEADMTNVKVVDTLPDGMAFDTSHDILVTDRDAGTAVDSSKYTLSTSGKKLFFSMNETKSPVQIDYWVTISGDATSKYTNTATVDYTADGDQWKESRNYVLQGTDYRASNGEKKVDKAIISEDPDDQIVTYSIKFWNDQGFKNGEIDLVDDLDKYISFVSAEDNEYFSVSQDKSDPQKILIVNTKPIDGSTTTYVRFTCDFSRVPVGYTVLNTVGGNTTKTKKYSGELNLTAKKTVNGEKPSASDPVFRFTLTGNGQNQTKLSSSDGTVQFDTINYGYDDVGKTFSYTVKEVDESSQNPKYTYDDSEYIVVVSPRLSDKDGVIEAAPVVKKDGKIVDSIEFNNKHEVEKTKVEGKKTWDDKDNNDNKRPKEIKINLLKNGNVIDTKTVTEKDNWAWSFADLDKFENGEAVNYSISEEAVEGYSTSYNGYDVTNSYTPGKTSVSVTKSWQDNKDQDGIRPADIEVQLLADGKPVNGKTLTLSEGNNWTGSFTELPEYDKGSKIAYTVEELTVKDYSSVITGDAAKGFTITNSHTPEKTKVEGKKTWDDKDNNDNKRPKEIKINLLKNGNVIDTKTVTEKDNWAWSFADLDKFENGEAVNYSISEEAVEGYSTSYNGYDVTNSYTPGKTSVSVTKSWQDNKDQDGIRPADIEVQLLADGKPVNGKTLTLSEGNNWTGSFTELPEYDKGSKIAYTVEELTVKDYSSVITGDAAKGFTITNSHNCKTTIVKTGDSTNLFVWVATMSTALILILVLIFLRKKKENVK